MSLVCFQYNFVDKKFQSKVTKHGATLDFSRMPCKGNDCNNMATYCYILFSNNPTFICESCKGSPEKKNLIRYPTKIFGISKYTSYS